MADFPEDFVSRRQLRDGTTITIRPIRPGDAPLERAFIGALSEESRYLRFQKWVAAPSDNLIHFLVDIDHARHVALVCTREGAAGEELVGEARYGTGPAGTDCEFGIMIADDWRKSGIAGLLMDALIRAARARGLKRMEGLVLRTNGAMLRFARALGFSTEAMPGDATIVRVVKTL
jgi:acetyltransferase